MLLQHATWRQVETYLLRSPGIVVPTGSTEQHGPMGLIGTDAICAEQIAARLALAHDVLVGPGIALGAAQFNLAFPGTVSLRASTLMAVITDYVESLARQGFTRFYFLNGHGGNVAPARAAFQDLYLAHPNIRCRLRSWWEYPAVDALRKQLYGASEGMHATPSEVAIVQALVPDAARDLTLAAPSIVSDVFLRNHAGDQHWSAAAHRAAFPDGRVGSHSALARPEHGERLLSLAQTDAWQDYQSFLTEV